MVVPIQTTSQGGIWIRIASSGRADEPGQRTV
jgi:hypothetical protein